MKPLRMVRNVLRHPPRRTHDAQGAAVQCVLAPLTAPLYDLPREDAAFAPIWDQCSPFTMTSFARGLALFRAVRYIVQAKIEGDIVECGVWRGGSSMIAMATLLYLNAAHRRIVMLDTFEGMTEPGKRDVDFTGADARGLLDVQKGQADGVLCYASLEEVQRNVESVGYPTDLIHYIVGDIRRTALKLSDRRDIALLRLDTDFYDGTKVELETFYPRLRDNGVLIVDDYGHWQGAREAVDQYFDTLRQNGVHAPMLTVIDYTGRLAVK